MKHARATALLPTLLLGLLLALAGCDRQAAQGSQAPPPAAKPKPPAASNAGWTWRPLGGLALVEGEVAGPTDLVLEGRSIREVRFAEAGAVRWELFRPPEGEAAVLRTGSGQILARFDFSRPPASRATHRTASGDRLAPPVSPQAPQTSLPTLARARFATTPVTAQTARPPKALPAAPASATNLTRVPPSPGSPFQLSPGPFTPASQATSWPGMGEALNLTRGPGGQKRLLLSFDGGSTSEVATEVLDALKARGVRTTIFLTGAFIQRYPALVKRMAAEGHELGNHTMNHPHFAPGMKRDPKWTRERVQRELLEADAALVRLLGRPMDPYWRAPYGEHTAEIRRWAEELGYRHVGWSEGADTLDWATPNERRLYRSGDAILRRLQQRLNRDGDGIIVLMHLGSERVEKDRPSAGLGAFMDRARQEGWTFVPAGTFLHDLGKPAWDPQLRLALLQPPGFVAQAR
jgi:peptidoglycan/xylan/chitin deacetylase (PgdA/CDA1 family)